MVALVVVVVDIVAGAVVGGLVVVAVVAVVAGEAVADARGWVACVVGAVGLDACCFELVAGASFAADATVARSDAVLVVVGGLVAVAGVAVVDGTGVVVDSEVVTTLVDVVATKERVVVSVGSAAICWLSASAP